MNVFATLKIKQNDFIEKNLAKICENQGFYRYHLDEISEILFRLGYDEETGLQNMITLFQKFD